jgi:hypothetical protein
MSGPLLGEYEDAFDPVLKPIVVRDRASLKEALVAWVDSNTTRMPLPIATVHLSRLYNKVATRYETSVADLLQELNGEGRLALIRDALRHNYYVLSAESTQAVKDAVMDEVTEGGKKTADPYTVGAAIKARLQLLIRMRNDLKE